MTDDPSRIGMPDRIRINVKEPYELRYWAKLLGVSDAKVKEAVSEVGVMVADVKKYLATSRKGRGMGA